MVPSAPNFRVCFGCPKVCNSPLGAFALSLIYSFVVAGDGVFATMGDGTIELVDLKSNSTTVLVKLKDIKDVSVTDFLAGVH